MINAILGAIFGDIVGSPYEVNNTKDYNFRLLSHKSGYTDDTVLTIATADWLINGGCIASYYDVYGNRYKGAGYSSNFSNWLNKSEKEPYGAETDGSAMRVSPVGCFYNTLEETIDAAVITASCTHNGEDGIKGAKFVAEAIFLIREGRTKEELKEALSIIFPSYDLNKKYDEVKKDYGWNYGTENKNVVPYAFIAFFESTDFEDAIRKAVSLGGDSDTLGAICGSMAGAYYGIPDKFIKEIYKRIPKEFIDILSQFIKTNKGF